ncbi:esterase/lipase family protein [Pedosphaera parvula]|uniref:AB hydrolase-1 domain-containing protein n=1 Tax=Pedosphaera parvula (strain Ellin514) TaxID=320771 RepID=B9XP74_PEDPL|nr:alpha/beta fold hydrolase [Pedosphaera parvula]EEF58325.1 conserved hypothetical protein [Pedosphaera parvula Ellin514]
MFSLVTLLTCALLLAQPATAISNGAASELNATQPGKEYVILLHGLGRTAISMKLLEWHLQRRGYSVVNVSYPGTRFSLETLSDIHLQRILTEHIPDSSAHIHFVTHSMGGILLRQYLSNHRIENLGSVVMLAPPNQGSELIDHLRSNFFTSKILGPAGMELGTGDNDLPQRLGKVGVNCGIIAGDRSLNPLLSSVFLSPNDGKVSVERTKIEGMSDFIILHSTHTWIMCRRQTTHQVLSFLQTGHFDHIGFEATRPQTHLQRL